MQLFLYSKWLSLPLPTRHKIAAQFGIIKRGSTEVVDNQVKSDGYKIQEVEEALNIDALQKYIVTTETDMLALWMWLVEKIEGQPLTQSNIDTTIEVLEKKVEEIMTEKPKRGRPKKLDV